MKLECKYQIGKQDKSKSLEAGLCAICGEYTCLEIKDAGALCFRCQNTGVTEVFGEGNIVICDKCVWGKWFEIEQFESQQIAIEGLEMLFGLDKKEDG